MKVADEMPPQAAGQMDVSIVMPCLNEERGVAECVRKALDWIGRSGMKGEVIVVDNGSTDRSAAVAAEAAPLWGFGSGALAGCGITAPVLPTGAGHDAGVLAARIPAAMLFVRNRSGVSHSPAEHAAMADCEAGVTALTAVLEDLAGR